MQTIAEWCHRHDVLIAMLLAAVFAVFFDAIRIGSNVRRLIRRLLNELSLDRKHALWRTADDVRDALFPERKRNVTRRFLFENPDVTVLEDDVAL